MNDTPTTSEGGGDDAQVIDLARAVKDPDYLRQLGTNLTSTPELGQRTPQPTINSWTRQGNTDLTIGEVASILRQGEEGRTQRLADLWLRMLKTDAHLASVWHTRIAPVASARWELSPGEGPESASRGAVQLRDACEEVLRGMGPLEPVFSRLLGALGPGYSVAEIVWGRGTLLGRPAWVPTKLKPIHARRFQFSDTFEIGLYDESTAVRQLEENGWEPDVITGRGGVMARLPAGKYLVFQPATIDDYPTATGLVHPVSRWWWAKQQVIKYWLAGTEFAGNARLIGKILQNAPGNAAEDLKDGLESLAADGVVILRDGTEIEIVEGKAQNSAAVWGELAKLMDAAMSKVVLGSTLNVEIGDTGGNRAAAESQDNVTIQPRQEQDGAGLWSMFGEQLFRYVREYNPHLFAPDTPLPVGEFVFAEDPVEVDQPIIDAGAVTMDELRVSRGLPEWGGERGAQIVQPPEQDYGRSFSNEPTPVQVAPPEVAASDAPFPWDLTRSRYRQRLPKEATQTSLHFPTQRSKSAPFA